MCGSGGRFGKNVKIHPPDSSHIVKGCTVGTGPTQYMPGRQGPGSVQAVSCCFLIGSNPADKVNAA